MDSTQSLVQINLYQSQIHPPQRGFVRESRAPGGAQCRAGRRATAWREVGRGGRRAAGQGSRGRLLLGWTAEALAGGGRRPVSVAVAWWRARRGRAWSSPRCVRRVWAEGWAHPRALGGPPSRRVAAPSVLPLREQCSGQQPVCTVRREIAEFGDVRTQEGDNFLIGGSVDRASRRRRRRAPGGGAHGTPKGTRPARIP